MTRHIRILLVIFLSLGIALPALAARYKYSELQIKDYDEMLNLVRAHTKKAAELLKTDADKETPTTDPAAVEQLREALLLILARPNPDNMLAKLLPEVRKELINVNAFEDSLASIASEAIDGLTNKNLPTVNRSTYLFVLENILSEFRPEIRDKDEIRGIFEKIRDAKIDVPAEVSKDLKLRSMLKVESPSERAKRALEGAPAKK